MGVFISVTLTGRDELPIEKPFHLHWRISNRPNFRLEMGFFSLIDGQISKWCKEGWGGIFGCSFFLYLLLLLLALDVLKIDNFWFAFLPGVISKKKYRSLIWPSNCIIKKLIFHSFYFTVALTIKWKLLFLSRGGGWFAFEVMNKQHKTLKLDERVQTYKKTIMKI